MYVIFFYNIYIIVKSIIEKNKAPNKATAKSALNIPL